MSLTIPLTRGYVAVISPEDADLAAFNWYAHVTDERVYAARRANNRIVKMHRVIAGRMVRRELTSAELVDHINRDSLNNTRTNLRLATHAQNSVNSMVRRDNTSGLRGVSWDKRRNRWRVNCAGRFVGYFVDKYEAHKAYLAVAQERWGEFICVEFEQAV